MEIRIVKLLDEVEIRTVTLHVETEIDNIIKSERLDLSKEVPWEEFTAERVGPDQTLIWASGQGQPWIAAIIEEQALCCPDYSPN